MKPDHRKLLFGNIEATRKRSLAARALGILFWVLVWAFSSFLVDFPLVFPGPFQVVRKLTELLTSGAFWGELLHSILMILAGWGLGVLLGVVSGLLSFRSSFLRGVIDPLFQIIRSVPIVAVIILLLVWIRPRELAIVIVVLAVSPLIYLSTLAGLSNRNQNLLEMARVFRLAKGVTWQVAYLPSLEEQLKPALLHASGYAWKAGISGEIIAQPMGSMGSAMAGAKITLSVDTLFAYVLVIVFLSALFSEIPRLTFARLEHRSVARGSEDETQRSDSSNDPIRGVWPAPEKASPAVAIRVRGLTHSYGSLKVLEDFHAEFPAGRTSVVTGATGVGKTTLFRLLLGLERLEKGRITLIYEGTGTVATEVKYSCCFQEPRLVNNLSALENLALTNGNQELCLTMLKLAGISQRNQPVAEFSGGMQQKVAILRAMLSDSEIILLDEPFKALDLASKRRMMDLVHEWGKGRTLILSTHSEEERRYFQGHEVQIVDPRERKL